MEKHIFIGLDIKRRVIVDRRAVPQTRPASAPGAGAIHRQRAAVLVTPAGSRQHHPAIGNGLAGFRLVAARPGEHTAHSYRAKPVHNTTALLQCA